MRRDVEGMLAEDQVTLVIDAEGAGRNGYLFAVNAHGAQFDALVYDGGLMRYDWDAQWQSEAHIESDGWNAQLAIPRLQGNRQAHLHARVGDNPRRVLHSAVGVFHLD